MSLRQPNRSLPLAAPRGGRGRHNPLGAIGALAMVMLAPLAAALLQAAISRQREFAAHSYGGELCGNPRKLVSVLIRPQAGNMRIPTDTPPAFHNMYIMQPLSTQEIAVLLRTHPRRSSVSRRCVGRRGPADPRAPCAFPETPSGTEFALCLRA